MSNAIYHNCYTSSQDEYKKPIVVSHPDRSQVALATERGERYRRMEKINEDGVATGVIDLESDRKLIIDLLVDGIGGSKNGAEASRIVLKVFQMLCETVPETIRLHPKPAIGFVEELIHGSHYFFEEQELSTCGRLSTFVAAIRDQDELVTAHLGDSRALAFDMKGRFQRATEDHGQTRYNRPSRRKLSALTRKFPAARICRDVDYLSFSLSKDFPHGMLLLLISDGIGNNVKPTPQQLRKHQQEFFNLSKIIARSGGQVDKVCHDTMIFARERMKDYIPFLGSELGAVPDNSSCIVHQFMP